MTQSDQISTVPCTPNGASLQELEIEHYLRYYEPALDTSSAQLVLFALPGRQTFASRDVTEIARKATSWSRAQNEVYLHIHLHELLADQSGHRGSRATVSAAIGLFSDIDARGPGRKKPPETLCPTVSDALWVVERFDKLYTPLQASMIIGSGHGCYPAMLFREPLLLPTLEDKLLLDSLSRRFHQCLHAIASERGWTGAVDLCDLARVLRLPGCRNFKDPDHPEPVRLLRAGEARFNLSDLNELLPPEKEPRPVMPKLHDGTAKTPNVELTLAPEAQPPFDKFEALRLNEPRFARSWDHRRSDLQDQSQSAYDQSLANFAALADWPDQEIADLLIANRRKHGADLKLRPDYYRRTIVAARRAAAPSQLDKKIVDFVQTDGGTAADLPMGNDNTGNDAPETEQGEPSGQAKADSPDRRRALLDMLSERFKVQIKRVVKFTGEPSEYSIETENGTVQLGGVDGLVSQNKLRLAIADTTGRYLPEFDHRIWPAIAQALLDVCEAVDRGEDATMHGTMSEWLRIYLGEKSIHPSLAEADDAREPFLHLGRVCIFSADLKRWLQIRLSERVTQGRLTADLRAFGAEPQVMDLVVAGKSTSRSAWQLPEGSWIPEPG